MGKKLSGGKNSNVGNGSNKISFFHSISFKIMALVAVCITVTVTICTLILVNNSKSEITGVTKDYMLYVAKSNKEALNKSGGQTSPIMLETIIGDVKIDGVESSYGYLVSPD